VLPTARRKVLIGERITASEIPASKDVSNRGCADLKLDVERNRLAFLNQGVTVLSLSNAPALDRIETELAVFERKVDCVRRLTELRSRVRGLVNLPPSITPKLLDMIVTADEAIVRSEIDKALRLTDEAEALTWAADDNTRLRDSLMTSIQEMLTLAQTPAGQIRLDDPWIKKLIAEDLPAALKRLQDPAPIERSQLIDWDQLCYAAHLYLVRYKGDLLLRYPSCDVPDVQNNLLAALKAGDRGLGRVRDLLDELQDGVKAGDVDAALEKGAGYIVCMPPQPSVNENAWFEFHFRDQAIDGSVNACRLEYVWRFGDGTKPTSGKTCVHYFREPTLKKYKCYLTISRNGAIFPPFRTEVDIFQQKSNKPSISYIDHFAFWTSVTIALFAAVVFHYSGMERFDTLNDYATPFLWGFGLDQLKDKFVRFPDVLSAVPKGGLVTPAAAITPPASAPANQGK
jgi:hypothetical protein